MGKCLKFFCCCSNFSVFPTYNTVTYIYCLCRFLWLCVFYVRCLALSLFIVWDNFFFIKSILILLKSFLKKIKKRIATLFQSAQSSCGVWLIIFRVFTAMFAISLAHLVSLAVSLIPDIAAWKCRRNFISEVSVFWWSRRIAIFPIYLPHCQDVFAEDRRVSGTRGRSLP